MRVLIDCTGVARQKAGVGVYARNLIEGLTRLPNGTKYFVLAQSDDRDLDFSPEPNVRMIKVPARVFRKLPLRFLLEQCVLPWLLVKFRIDVLHSLHYSFPLIRFGTKQVVTLHDMTFFNMPEAHERFKVVYFRFFIRADVRYADTIIFVSNSTKNDCIAQLGKLRGNSAVIPHGKSEVYGSSLAHSDMARVRKKYGLAGDFILFVGTIEPRKNLTRLVTAFALISNDHADLLLVIAGMKGWMYQDLMQTVRDLKLASRVIFTGFVSEEEKPFLVASAKVFAYPSLYEGFGLPVLEALACGIPTVTSNVSSLPEVVGRAALTIDPTSVPDLAAALNKLLSDAALRAQLTRDSILQASRFSWTNTAKMTAEVYRDTLSRKNRRITR